MMILSVLIAYRPIHLTLVPPRAEIPPREPFLGALGAQLRRERETRALSMEDLEELSGVDASMIGLIERGQRNPSIVILGRMIVLGLGMTLAEFFSKVEALPAPSRGISPEERRRIAREKRRASLGD